MSYNKIRLDRIINFNPSRIIKKGNSAPFVEMAGIPEGNRDINYTFQKEFNGSGSKFRNGDTLFARITPCLENGKTAKVSCLKKNEVGHGSTEFIVFSAKEPTFDEDFIYYLCRWPKFREFAKSRMEGTSGRQRVDWKVLAESEWELPEKEERKEIGLLLKQIDDKISNNIRINRTLEEIAQALFRSWFVDFEPVKAKIQAKAEGDNTQLAAMIAISGKTQEELLQLPRKKYNDLANTADLFPDELVESDLGMIPKGWRADKIGNYFPTMGGYAFSSKDFTGVGDTVVKIKNINEDGRVDLIDTQKISPSITKTKEKFELKDGDIIMAMTGATIGKVGIVVKQKTNVFLNQRVAKFILKDRKFKNYWFVYQFFKQENNRNLILSTSQGSAQPNISTGGIDSVKSVFANKDVIIAFNVKVSVLYSKWMSNEKENNKLSELRDFLLPNLLSEDGPLLKSVDYA